jgi:hypothetical protein
MPFTTGWLGNGKRFKYLCATGFIREDGMMFPGKGVRQTVVPLLPGVQEVFNKVAVDGS